MTIDEMIAVLQAAKAGKTIQYYSANLGGWFDCASTPYWDFDQHPYRVKPEPREFWIVRRDNRHDMPAYSCPQRGLANLGAGYEQIRVREVLP